ncbi:MAG TPA: hypothetical protein VMB24_01175, partial [Dehalococcoidales bacterium]|nr:hypothetical protein [Dehalococcoidales bacterium]
FALTNVTFPYILKLADMGCQKALETDSGLRKGVNVYQGKLVYEPVARSLDLPYTPLEAF